MNEQDKAIQYCFCIGVLILFAFGICYFSTSNVDKRRSEDVGARISDSQNINCQLQDGNRELQQKTNDSQRAVEDAIQGLGNAEAELDRAKRSIERCEQILRTAESRAQETDTTIK